MKLAHRYLFGIFLCRKKLFLHAKIINNQNQFVYEEFSGCSNLSHLFQVRQFYGVCLVDVTQRTLHVKHPYDRITQNTQYTNNMHAVIKGYSIFIDYFPVNSPNIDVYNGITNSFPSDISQFHSCPDNLKLIIKKSAQRKVVETKFVVLLMLINVVYFFSTFLF